jgi:hypothetical protein
LDGRSRIRVGLWSGPFGDAIKIHVQVLPLKRGHFNDQGAAARVQVFIARRLV